MLNHIGAASCRDSTIAPPQVVAQIQTSGQAESDRMQRMATVSDIADKAIRSLDMDVSPRLGELTATCRRSLITLDNAACAYQSQGTIDSNVAGNQSLRQYEHSRNRVEVIRNWAEGAQTWVMKAQQSVRAFVEAQRLQIDRLERRRMMDLETSHLNRPSPGNYDVDNLLCAFESISINIEQELCIPKVGNQIPIKS